MVSKRLSTKTLNNSKRFFTPIVASSLALFLGAGVANAADCAGTSPSICWGSTPVTTSFSGLTLPVSGNTFTPTYTGGATPIAIENLEFQFHGGANGKPTGSWNDKNNAYFIKSVTGGNEIFTLNGNGKGMKMGENGDKTLTIYFAEGGADNKRVFTLNLDGMNSDTYAFEGKLVVQPGKGVANGDEPKMASL